MRVLIQRVSSASVSVAGSEIGRINQGLLALVGIEPTDTAQTLTKMANKLLAYRVFNDAEGKMNLNVQEVHGGLLLVSQFTLAADTDKGLRPGFSSAAPPAQAELLFNEFVTLVQSRWAATQTGKFGADMQVALINDGPVTFLLQMK
ncbi:MAG TPA: D-aminoacyl-tRNA deacylase [Cellvibrionaceae bacterium]|nr:D-aminoacyl-tRNA deacylase [Cellvibrionaceae bacterium]HMY40146.1 D-aminoacyl-tRNA deacylase [Marinagarivorans sp.]HNG59968.1 D-aminoacyl-tRNA deacylase [Cellvibrionaceae bacterium]